MGASGMGGLMETVSKSTQMGKKAHCVQKGKECSRLHKKICKTKQRYCTSLIYKQTKRKEKRTVNPEFHNQTNTF